MGRGVVLALALVAAVAVPPARAAVDLLQRLEEKGIISAAERRELAAEQGRVVPSPDGIGLIWETADGRFATTLGGYGQLRYTFQDADGAGNGSSFAVQRVRLGLKGHSFVEELRYGLALDLYSGNGQSTVLEQYWVDYAPRAEVGTKVGQFKVPYGLQWNISASAQQFVDRTTVDGNFRFDYDTGLALHGRLIGGVVGYDAGVFNGEGKNRRNPDDKHLFVGRLTLQPLGRYAMAESDTGRSEAPALLLGVAVAHNRSVASHTRSNLDGRLTALGPSDVISTNLFAGLRAVGASLQGEFHRRRIDPRAPASREETALGFYAQGGYLVWGENLEVAARYEYFDPDVDATDDLKQQYGVGVNWFLAGHDHKLQADGFRVNTQNRITDSADDNVLRVQYQIKF